MHGMCAICGREVEPDVYNRLQEAADCIDSTTVSISSMYPSCAIHTPHLFPSGLDFLRKPDGRGFVLIYSFVCFRFRTRFFSGLNLRTEKAGSDVIAWESS